MQLQYTHLPAATIKRASSIAHHWPRISSSPSTWRFPHMSAQASCSLPTFCLPSRPNTTFALSQLQVRSLSSQSFDQSSPSNLHSKSSAQVHAHAHPSLEAELDITSPGQLQEQIKEEDEETQTVNRRLQLLLRSMAMQRAVTNAGVRVEVYRIASLGFLQRLSRLPLLSRKEITSLKPFEAVQILLPYFLRYLKEPGLVAKLQTEALKRVSLQTGVEMDVLKDILDLRQPHEWYPAARAMKRKIIVHAGPTNSGKTYSAMQALISSSSGVYCGPLRLLAWEVREKLVAKGVKCDLITGQEVIREPGARHAASTIEMCELRTPVQVAVLDEIQMLGDTDRGSSWTRALLGLPAEEIHVCGDAAAIPVVQSMVELTGDEIEIKTYDRLSPLSVDRPLRGLHEIQKGDCVIGFGRRELYRLKNLIESKTNRKCCIIYGSLPPETRKQQAQLYNEGKEYDVLVASDAIGMGLNLNIRRVVFSTVEKFDGQTERLLTVSELKQIAGRAGRFGTDFAQGLVTGMTSDDVEYIKRCLQRQTPKLNRMGIFPPVEQIEELMLAMFKQKPLSLSKFTSSAKQTVEPVLSPAFAALQKQYLDEANNSDETSTNHSAVNFTTDSLSSSNQKHKVVSDWSLPSPNPHHVSSPSDASSEAPSESVTVSTSTPATTESESRSSTNRTKDAVTFSKVLEFFRLHSSLDGLYFMCDPMGVLEAAELIENIELDVRNRFVFCQAPLKVASSLQTRYFQRYAREFAAGKLIKLGLKINADATPSRHEDLQVLEDTHGVLEMYIWLARRFPDQFYEIDLATEQADLSSKLINTGLEVISANSLKYAEDRIQRMANIRGKRMQQHLRNDNQYHDSKYHEHRARHSRPGERNQSQSDRHGSGVDHLSSFNIKQLHLQKSVLSTGRQRIVQVSKPSDEIDDDQRIVTNTSKSIDL